MYVIAEAKQLLFWQNNSGGFHKPFNGAFLRSWFPFISSQTNVPNIGFNVNVWVPIFIKDINENYDLFFFFFGKWMEIVIVVIIFLEML